MLLDQKDRQIDLIFKVHKIKIERHFKKIPWTFIYLTHMRKN